MSRLSVSLSLKMILFGLILLVSSCKKDPEPLDPENPGQEQPGGGGGGNNGTSSLPCAGKDLKIQSFIFTLTEDESGEETGGDLVDEFPECAKDDRIRFEKSGKISGSEGSKVCPPDEEPDTEVPVPVNSLWSYNAQNKTFKMYEEGNPNEAVVWKVDEVSSSSLKISITEKSEGYTTKIVLSLKQ